MANLLHGTPCFGSTLDLANRVQVSFDGAQISDGSSRLRLVKNSGNCAILGSDFERPIAVNFGDGVTTRLATDKHSAIP